jgi:hypothetical protein
MIPTRSKAKLSRHLSYPVGAETISRALENTTDLSQLTLSFWESPIWPASSFQEVLEGCRPYTILVLRLLPATKPGYSASNDMIARGWYEERREITVYPVKRESRHLANRLLVEEGLPFVGRWLLSTRLGHDSVSTSIELRLVFDPARENLMPEGSNVPRTCDDR